MKKLYNIMIILIFVVITVTQIYFRVPSVQETVASYTEDDFMDDNIYSNLDELAKRLDKEILDGEESFTVYLENMELNEIDNINHSLNGIYGSGATYQQVGSIGDKYKKVKIKIKRNTNYYVLTAYTKGSQIPEEEVKAKHLYEKVKEVLDDCIKVGMTDYEKELALHDYLVTHCKYSENTDQNSESDIYRAYGALVKGDAVCNGYAEALQLMFNCIGVESKFVVGTADGIDHAWNLVKLGDNWYHLDATWDDPLPDQGDNASHPYFNVSDEIMSNNHTWDKDDYPNASDMTYNYYVYNHRYFDSFDEYKTVAYEEMIQHGISRYEAVIEGYTENEDDMQFLFDGSYRYGSVNWQTFNSGRYHVLILEAQ